MRRARAAWIGILLLNLAWLLILPSTSDKVFALAGLVFATCALTIPRIVFQHDESHAHAGGTRLRDAVLILPFLLPAVALVSAPTIVFWKLDGGSWLILAWLWTGSLLSVRGHGTFIFIVATAAFFTSLVAGLGIQRIALETDRTVPMLCRSDVLTTAFSIWEANPAREHLFLGWRSEESFRARSPYANHVHPYLLTMYAWVAGVRLFGGVPTYVATNSIPFFYMFVLLAGFTTLLARAGLLRARHSPTGLVTMFVAYGLIVTSWRFWNDLYRFGSDNPYPLLMGVLLFVYAFLREPLRPGAAAVSAAIFIALSPIHLPMLLLGMFVLFGYSRPVVVTAIAATAAGVVSYLTPWLLIAGNDYQAVGSTFLLRSGLDGDTRYFSNIAQAAIAPCIRGGCCWARPVWTVLWPSFVPLVVLALAVLRREHRPHLRWGHLLLFLTTPYFVSLVLFPQSVSIHPYLYDHMLLAPVIVSGSAMLLTPELEQRLRGAGLLVFLLGAGAMLMANLNAIAQSVATMPR